MAIALCITLSVLGLLLAATLFFLLRREIRTVKADVLDAVLRAHPCPSGAFAMTPSPIPVDAPPAPRAPAPAGERPSFEEGAVRAVLALEAVRLPARVWTGSEPRAEIVSEDEDPAAPEVGLERAANLSDEEIARVDALAAAEGVTRAAMLARMVEGAYAEARRGVPQAQRPDAPANDDGSEGGPPSGPRRV